MIPLTHCLCLSFFLFFLGFLSLVIRRNLFFILIGLEIMFNAASLLIIIASSYLGQIDGQVIYIFVIMLAASEGSIGLALLLRLYRRYQTLNIDILSEMRG
ncbi:NADH-quinone oxidoreductase subunit K [Buchnera aphidicola (Eriosoma grossulariae)]|uniref:NADH-quinone oxidoreductase subunit NuoK n=1 Tax=Buchnera aphidicola TaxID=9 RepID=UPI003463E25C